MGRLRGPLCVLALAALAVAFGTRSGDSRITGHVPLDAEAVSGAAWLDYVSLATTGGKPAPRGAYLHGARATLRANGRDLGTWSPVVEKSIDDGAKPLSGRLMSIAVDPSDSEHLLIGSSGGGVWETDDDGDTWSPRTDDQPMLAMGAIAFAPSNPSIVYAGTGNDAFPELVHDPLFQGLGAGILKSTDGGTTWTLIAAGTFTGARFSDVLVSPSSANLVVTGGTFGIQRSTDGGTTWQQQLNGVVTDLVADPTDFLTQFAAVAEEDGRAAPGVWRSTDGGVNWSRLTLPGGALPARTGRVMLGIAPSEPDVLYTAITSHQAGSTIATLAGLWRTDDARGATPSWTQVMDADTSPCGISCYFNMVMSVHPTDPGHVFLGGIWMTECAGCDTPSPAWSASSAPIHYDYHAMTWHATTAYFGGDGGIWKSPDGGSTWESLNDDLATVQFYFGARELGSGRILGGTQDNATLLGPGAHWSWLYGGDGGMPAISPSFPGIWLIASQVLGIVRAHQPTPAHPSWEFVPTTGLAGEPSLLIPPSVACQNGNVALAGGDNIWRSDGFFDLSTDVWPNWTANGPTGGRLSAIAFPPSAKGCATYAYGDENGELRLTTNAGKTWKNLDPSNQVPNLMINDLVFDPDNAKVAYVVLPGYGNGHVYRTTDLKTWTNVSPPADLPGHGLAIDPLDPNVLFLGTELGVWKSADRGSTWAHFTPASGLPNAVVWDLVATTSPHAVVAFTHGRGAFELALPGSRPGPQVTGFSPATGVAGTKVTITGTNLMTANVTFGGAPAVVTSAKAAKVVALVPPTAAIGPLVVTTRYGRQTAPGGAFAPLPRITAVDPPTPATGDEDYHFILGTNLWGASDVKLNGVPIDGLQSISETKLFVEGIPGTTGNGALTVTTPTGTSAPFAYRFVPRVFNLTPSSGPVGTSVTIGGMALNGATVVSFHGKKAKFTVVSPSQITATAPKGATTGPVTVTTPGGTAQSPGDFTVAP